MKRFAYAVCGILMAAGLAWAIDAMPKVWSSGDTITATDLNNNMNHLHNGLRGGSHQLIANADLSLSLALQQNRMKTPALLPRAWAAMSAVCTTGTCSLAASSGVTSVTFSSAGNYGVTLNYTPANASFFVLQQTVSSTMNSCTYDTAATSAPNFLVHCSDRSGTATNAQMGFLVMDDDNPTTNP